MFDKETAKMAGKKSLEVRRAKGSRLESRRRLRDAFLSTWTYDKVNQAMVDQVNFKMPAPLKIDIKEVDNYMHLLLLKNRNELLMKTKLKTATTLFLALLEHSNGKPARALEEEESTTTNINLTLKNATGFKIDHVEETED